MKGQMISRFISIILIVSIMLMDLVGINQHLVTAAERQTVYFGRYYQEEVTDKNTISYLKIVSFVDNKATVGGVDFTKKNGRYYYSTPIEWEILEDSNNNYLLMSKKILDTTTYSSSIGWPDSKIRKWCNDTFYNQAFTMEEQDDLAEETLENDCLCHDPIYTHETIITKDYVWLLDENDILMGKYGFSDTSDASHTRIAYDTQYVNSQELTDSWYLRGKPYWYYYNAYVGKYVSSSGEVHVQKGVWDGSAGGNYSHGIRPVIRVNKDSKYLSTEKSDTNYNVISEYIPSSDAKVYLGGNKTKNDKFTIGADTKFTIPSNVPLIGGGEISLDFGNIPVQFEREGNDFKIGIGVSDLKKLKEDGWFTFKKFVDTQKEEYKKGINSLLASKFGKTSMGMKVKPNIKCFGYVEGTITSKTVQSVCGKMFIEIKAKASQEWQTMIVVVPVVIKFSGEAGIKTNMSVGLDYNNSEIKLEGDCDFALPKLKLSVGAGISHIADISVYGSVSNNIKLSSNKAVTASLTGEMGASAKLLFASYEKAIFKGTWEYYSKSNKKTRSNSSLKKVNDWKANVDNTKATEWNSYMDIGQKLSDGLCSNTIIQSDVYDNSCPQLLKTKGGVYVLSYITAVEGRTTGNQYAAAYSVYNPKTKLWSEPVVIDDDGTPDFYLNSVVDGNDIYFTWSNLNDELSSRAVKNLDVGKAASMTEIEVAKLELSSGKITVNTVTNNDTSDIMPKLYADDTGVVLGWCENQSNSLSDMSGTNIIHMGYIENLEFSKMSEKKVSNPVRALAVGKVNSVVQTAYIENAPNRSYVNVLTENGESLSLASTSDVITKVSCDTIKRNNVFLWYAQNNVNSCIYMNNGISTKTLIENIDTNSCYDVLNEADRDIIVTSSTADNNDKDSKIVGYIVKDTASESIKLMETKGQVSNFSLENYGNGYILLYTASTAKIGKDSVDARTNLCVAVIGNEDYISIEDISYLEEEFVPQGKSTVAVRIKNNGFENANRNTSVVVYCDTKEVGRTELGNVLSGDSDIVDVNVELPEGMSQNTALQIKVERGGTILDEKDFIVGLADIGLSVEKNDKLADVTVSNESAYTTDAVLNIYDTNIDGAKLASFNLGAVAAGANIKTTYDISDYLGNGIESLLFVITTDTTELFNCNNTAALYIGEDKLKTLDHISATKDTVVYKTGDKLSTNDLSVYATYTDGTSKKVTSYVTNLKSINMSISGSKSLNVTYEEMGIIRDLTIPITVIKSNTRKTPITSKSYKVQKEPKIKKPGRVKSVKVKKKKKRSVVVTWAKISGAKGYQIQYATSKKFKKKKSKYIKKKKYTVKKLKKKIYYIRVRAYKLSGKKKVYGKWSKVKKCKVKK